MPAQTNVRVSAQNAEKFVISMREAANGSRLTLDAVHDAATVGVSDEIRVVLDAAGDNSAKVANALLDGVAAYEKQHGASVPAELIEHALHLAYATTDAARKEFALDSATSTTSDPYSLQANRAVVSIMSTLGTAIPFANYLPADIGSNEAKLAIVSHVAANAYGEYTEQGAMDGALSGRAYMTSERVHLCTIAGANMTGKLTHVQSDSETCDQTAAGAKLVRGGSEVFVNGMFAAREIDSRGSGLSTVSGKIKLMGAEYVIGGTVNTDTGEIGLTSTPALPVNTKVHVYGYIDYERDASMTPSIITRVDDYSLFAKPSRVTTFQSVDSRTQMSNELGLDPYAEAVYSIHNQFANERHVAALRKLKRVATNNSATYDFNFAAQTGHKTRTEIWNDFAGILGAVSQQMALDTMSYGVTHLYVGKVVAAQLRSLGSDMFAPSGLGEQAGIYRIGKLFGAYDVYFSPSEHGVITETATASQILCIGRSADAARCPIVLGDAVPPTMIPLAVNADLKTGAGFYARTFTSINPHAPSARGAAMIDIINLA